MCSSDLTLPVADFFRATGLATHGNPCVTLQDEDGNQLRLHAYGFDYSGDPVPEWLRKRLDQGKET